MQRDPRADLRLRAMAECADHAFKVVLIFERTCRSTSAMRAASLDCGRGRVAMFTPKRTGC